jgi:hypothetical protein
MFRKKVFLKRHFLSTHIVPNKLVVYIAKVTKRKDKFHPRTGHEGADGEQNYGSNLSLTPAIDDVDC